ncbi:MAG: DUF4124 domain-containing protein [Gammaproteobacteria bacterium]|nr:DUF4124 domain-containing protein [Gammaproteobacteria bacterium]
MSLRILPGLICVALSASASAAPGYHLWYDENGQAVYSQFAPGEGRESRLVKPPPPPADPEGARQQLQDRLQRFEDQREDEALAREKATASAEQDAMREKRCTDARSNLENLNGPARRLFRTPDGVRRLTDQERQAQITDMQKIIAEDCK